MAQPSTTTTGHSAGAGQWDTAYEWKAVALLGLGFGLVGLDRWIIAPLFPFIAADLGLPEGEIGVGGRLSILGACSQSSRGACRTPSVTVRY
jgi:hypothetical protein